MSSNHAERIALRLMLGGFEDIRYGRQVVEVERLPHLTDTLYTPHIQILWIEGRNLMNESGVWVPYEMVHLDHTLPLPTGHGCFVPSSNGLASGNHLYEAMSHGTCEVLERDSTTLWHLLDSDEQEMTRVNLDPVCRELLDKYHNAGVPVAVWETTSDVGLPSFLCRILQEAPLPYNDCRPASGMGCHPMAEIAMSRALTEAAQSRLTFISGVREDLWRSYMEKSWDDRAFDQIVPHRNESFENDIAWQLEHLRAVGVNQVIAVDLTKPEFCIPVVRMIILGLEGMDHSPEYIPGECTRVVMQRCR